MGMREVRVYEGDFPSRDQILSGDPDAVFPNQSWLQEIQAGEFAVHYKDFKTQLPRNPAGELVAKSRAICRVFSTLEEARVDSHKVVKQKWPVRCFIYDHTGAEVETVSNDKEVNKFAAVVYAGILLYVGIFTATGMGVIWLCYRISLLFLSPYFVIRGRLGLPAGMAWAFSGLLVGIFAWWRLILFKAKRKMTECTKSLKILFRPRSGSDLRN